MYPQPLRFISVVAPNVDDIENIKGGIQSLLLSKLIDGELLAHVLVNFLLLFQNDDFLLTSNRGIEKVNKSGGY